MGRTAPGLRCTPRFLAQVRRLSATLDARRLELVLPDGRHLGLVGQEAYLGETGRALPVGHVFWVELGLSFRPARGALRLDFLPDLRLFDWAERGPRLHVDRRVLAHRVRALLERAPDARRIRLLTARADRVAAAWRRWARPVGGRGGGRAAAPAAIESPQLLRARANAGRRGNRPLSPGWLAAEALVRRWAAAGVQPSSARLARLNRLVLAGTRRAASAGALRTFECSVYRRPKLQYAPAAQLPRLWARLLERDAAYRRENAPAVLRAAALYQGLCTLHPWPDGNGRTARLAMDWCLSLGGLPPALLAADEALVALFGTLPRQGQPTLDEVTARVVRGTERTVRRLRAARGGGRAPPGGTLARR